ncbi:hypothetical protein ACFB49_32910 [Sphingomonas sp. DBB INV C78]
MMLVADPEGREGERSHARKQQDVNLFRKGKGGQRSGKGEKEQRERKAVEEAQDRRRCGRSLDKVGEDRSDASSTQVIVAQRSSPPVA